METLKKFEERIEGMDVAQLTAELENQSISCKEDSYLSVKYQQGTAEEIRDSYEPFKAELKRRIKEHH